MFTYRVSVETGKQAFSGTLNYIYLTLVGEERSSDRTLLDKSWFTRLERGLVVSIDIHVEETLGELLLVKLEKEKTLINDDWYCRSISVTAPTGDCFEFPCYHWIADQQELVLPVGRGRLPQDEKLSILKQYRQLELENRQKHYRWNEWKAGLPLSIDANGCSELPLDVQFDTAKTVDFSVNFLEGIGILGLNKLKSLFQSWKDLEDFERIFIIIKNTVSEYLMENWTEDVVFGYQFLNGSNPVMIKKCKKLPDKFAVTQEMVDNSLDRGTTLQEELQAGNIYIADYEILEDVQPNDTDSSTQQYLAAPFCLFYKNIQNKIIPIAIQLSREATPGQKNTVFLPSDNQYDWMLAKMWVKSCDFNVHQLITHLLRTHLISEVFAIAMFRQLSAVHPVYKLLIPHVRFTIAINTSARQTLINDTGVFNKANSSGGIGVLQVIHRAMKTLTYKSLCLPEDLKSRDVHNQEDLPNYYYRDDGMMVWEAVKSFVSDVVEIYYSSDETVQKDEEIQAFVQDVYSSGMKNCPNSGEFPNVLKTREQLVEYLTLVIFTASAQHAAVNFGQFDWFSWVPNTPSTMRKPPPTEKGKVDMKYIMESLPDRGRSSWHLGALWSLSQFQDNELFLGEYPDKHFTEEAATEAIHNFRKKLIDVTKIIRKRNETLELPYWYLSPDRIPNSVAI
ncbi:arachidonate 5-lipoxygenase b, tandem duplicate 3 [Danio aesculapii]|uniref:arachidonate 5-lipoxygenase b, tandem duplicate 3 n=1 Tax=Danio aesculapii TaxID=1142201 RepID=UPI0024BFEF13|nr:arachidonate 5-lipoxygenase b, tandem duplicate 3 [Danio aesculapii]XP_056330460.1 arachidonate 5-lipoxygenase b, tandem duplicate 3 [Danio aesculapii]